MEGVECHLGGRFSDGLGCKRTTHLSGMGDGLIELGFHLTNDPIKGLSHQVEPLQQHGE